MIQIENRFKIKMQILKLKLIWTQVLKNPQTKDWNQNRDQKQNQIQLEDPKPNLDPRPNHDSTQNQAFIITIYNPIIFKSETPSNYENSEVW